MQLLMNNVRRTYFSCEFYSDRAEVRVDSCERSDLRFRHTRDNDGEQLELHMILDVPGQAGITVKQRLNDGRITAQHISSKGDRCFI